MTSNQSLRRTGAVASAACLLAVAGGATTAQAAAPDATISAVPDSTYVRYGEPMQLSGTCAGLTAETGVVLITATVDGEEVPDEAFVLEPDDSGEWQIESTVLDDATVGDWLFTAQCVDYDLVASGATASAGWIVLATLSGVISDPTMTASGDVATISATGFAPGETVEVTLDGEFLTSDTAAEDGTILGELTLTGSELGEHTLRLVGLDSDGVVEIRFTVIEVEDDPEEELAGSPWHRPTASPAAPTQSYKPAPAAVTGGGLPRAASDVVL